MASGSTNEPDPKRSFLSSFGPGVLFAGTSVGVSHLVQSTRAGAVYGLAMLSVIIFANVLKYPGFAFGPLYASATGESLIEGYRRLGRWAVWLYLGTVFGTMFTALAAIAMVTAGVAKAVVGIDVDIVWVASSLIVVSAVLVNVGGYRWLDRIMKFVVALLTLLTLAATALVLPSVSWSGQLWPSAEVFGSKAHLFFVAALVGWMPSGMDVSVWHSLWTVAKQKETRAAPSPSGSRLDFNIGYITTAILAICFMLLGAGVMHGAAVEIPNSAGGFAAMLLSFYAQTLGAWSEPLIGGCALLVMVSTTLALVDGAPRTVARALLPERESHRLNQWANGLSVLAFSCGAILIIFVFASRLRTLVDLATSISFVIAPLLAWFNHRAMHAAHVPLSCQPGPAMRRYSLVCIWVLSAFSVGYLYLRFGA